MGSQRNPLKSCAAPAAGAEAIAKLIGETRQSQFDALAQAAATMLGCPLGAITVVERKRQWFKAVTDANVGELPIEESICRHALTGTDLLVVEDLAADPRFANNRLVTQEGMRFYAGHPIHARLEPDGPTVPVGALCVVDFAPREFSPESRLTLEQLGIAAQTLVQATIDAVQAQSTARRTAKLLAELQRTHRQLRQGEKIAGFGSWRLCLATNRVDWSDQVYAIHEVPVGQEEMLEDALSFYPPPHRAIVADAVEQAIATGRSYDCEVDFDTARGRRRRVRAMGEVELENGKPIALIGVFQDVTDRYRLEQALLRKANTDELTGITSRRRFNECFEAQAATALSQGDDIALLLIDLDRFKEANDRFGHAVGDELLQMTAQVLTEPWLKGSLAARLGGDEFVLLVTDRDLVRSLDGLIGQLLLDLRLNPSRDPGFAVSATIGAIRTGDATLDRGQMMGAADRALYEAKARGRGSAVINENGRDRHVAVEPGNNAPIAIRAA